MNIKSVFKQYLILAGIVLLNPCFATNASNFIENKRSIICIQDEYRINGYKKGFNGWEKVPLKIRVTQPSFGKEKIEVIAYQTSFGWLDVSYCYVTTVREIFDGKEAAANFEYKASCGGMVFYFNF